MSNISIIGSGSWGIALAIHLASLGNNIKVWSFMEDEAKLINEEKKCKFLPGIDLPENIYATLDLKEAIEGTELILHVTPSKFTRDTLKQYKEYVTNQKILICSKGFEKDTLKTLDEVFKEELPNVKIGVFTGPSHAEEVSRKVPTAMVVASEDDELIEKVQKMFSNENLRIYASKDVLGTELGGALKNIIAFSAGIISGIENLGDNTFAALITRGLNEISNLGVKLRSKQRYFLWFKRTW